MRAALVGLDFGKNDFAASLDELYLLAKSAGAEPVITITGRRASPDAALFIGTGKAQEVADAVADLQLELVIFNHALSPAQQRNLERLLKVRVLDRTSLILDIFAQRAKSHEGKVQVELAQLQHLSTRLIRGWTHLERQKGGIGLRGPGETQLETDRRLLGERVKALRAVLAKLRRQHATQRRARGRNETFSVSLVGYTNAGKSTIFNALAKAGVYAANQLFATLDTTSRRVYLGEVGHVVISDTVGFIRELPHQLVEAFRATLEETIHADLLLHVVDAASPVRMEQIEEVNLVLKEIGADHVPQILVWNKIDAAGLEPTVEYDEYGKIQRVFVSAKSGAGLDLLREAIAASLKAALEARGRSRSEPVDSVDMHA
ncbi:GTPase HflX [Herbaspirillum seropedicae]|jgi:GTP-binding protein HflX|uniref:GTPase HflX n=1 Tax=Herbaspirillum seropedicae (strain SmR1) TaxID=757424 RepID=D8IZU5_HERSS|nr:GTPase HflX [Herbaspirillum seropedicae]ADJ64435.1 GTP-binding protein [Herbaspirillum seropedicae SmR1]AKN66362.1 GTP-binding protein HflX [Herbaspirillum seropedicae]AON55180.1 GTP-binding protein [Herbaspirillum seropedicae]MDR6393750.1 GTP-binding protein HflX [Herbaspirillum seropedicae]NQE30532.1 GTP-binding protein HflX [Herbaspirillum seropedicae]